MSESRKIPLGWNIVKLGEIATYINGKAFKPTEWSKEGLPIIRIQNLNRDKSEFNYCNFTIDDKYYVNKGDLLFAWSGTPDTSFGAHIWLGGRAVLNQHIFRIVINETRIIKHYYLYVLNHKIKEFVSKAHGTAGLAHITKKIFEESAIALPPLPEQHRIVSKIEELFSSLDKGIESLKTAQQQLKVYRQAVLKWAFEGKLTNTNVIDGELPEGWKWVKLGEIADKITDGEHITPKRTTEGVYLLSARNIQNGFLSLEKVDYIPESEYQRIIKRCNPEEGDILISCSGSVGRICRVPQKLRFNLVRSVALVKLNLNKYDSKYFEYLLLSPLLQAQIEKGKKATAQANLFLGPIKNLEVIVSSRPEQKAIVAEIESRLSVCDKIEESIEYSLKQSEALRQSILKKAFEGKLVPQDPNDEPASVLLARIKAEREKDKPVNPPRRQAGKTKRKRQNHEHRNQQHIRHH
jgi:type I restriction enzyme S subunit